MCFLVSVRWHGTVPGEVYTHAWIVRYVRGDEFFLLLDDIAGIKISIPLELIEHVQMERKG